MPPIPPDSRKYNPYETCVNKSVLMCAERGRPLDFLKMAKIENRCEQLTANALSWDTPAEKISEVVDDLCPPPSGGGGRMISVRIQGTNPSSTPGKLAYSSLEVEKESKLPFQRIIPLNPRESGTVLSRLSNPSGFTPAQLVADHAVSSFLGGVTDVQTLTALTGGGFAYRLGRLGVLGLGVESVSGSVLPAMLRGGSYLAGFAAESFTFAGVNRGFSYLEGNRSLNSFAQDWAQAAITLAPLKIVPSLFQNQNLVLQHLATDGAMVAGNQLAYRLNLGDNPEGDLLTQLFHSESMNWQMKGSMALVHSTAPVLSSAERSLDLLIRTREGGLQTIFNPILSNAAMEMAGGSQTSPRILGKEGPLVGNNILMASVEDPPGGKGVGPEKLSDPAPPSGIPRDAPLSRDPQIAHSLVFWVPFDSKILTFDFSKSPVVYLYLYPYGQGTLIDYLQVGNAHSPQFTFGGCVGSIEKSEDSLGFILKDAYNRIIPIGNNSVFSIGELGLLRRDEKQLFPVGEMSTYSVLRPLSSVLAQRLVDEGGSSPSLREILNRIFRMEIGVQIRDSNFHKGKALDWARAPSSDLSFSPAVVGASARDVTRIATILRDYLRHPLHLVRERAHMLNNALLSQLSPEVQQNFIPPLNQPFVSHEIQLRLDFADMEYYFLERNLIGPAGIGRAKEGQYYIESDRYGYSNNFAIEYFMIEREGKWVVPPPQSPSDFRRYFTPGDRIRLQNDQHYIILSTAEGDSPNSLIITIEGGASKSIPQAVPQTPSPEGTLDPRLVNTLAGMADHGNQEADQALRDYVGSPKLDEKSAPTADTISYSDYSEFRKAMTMLFREKNGINQTISFIGKNPEYDPYKTFGSTAEVRPAYENYRYFTVFNNYHYPFFDQMISRGLGGDITTTGVSILEDIDNRTGKVISIPAIPRRLGEINGYEMHIGPHWNWHNILIKTSNRDSVLKIHRSFLQEAQKRGSLRAAVDWLMNESPFDHRLFEFYDGDIDRLAGMVATSFDED